MSVRIHPLGFGFRSEKRMPSMLAAGPVAKPTGKYARLAAIREWRQAQREKREKEKQQVWFGREGISHRAFSHRSHGRKSTLTMSHSASFFAAPVTPTALQSFPPGLHPASQVLYCEWIAGDEMANEDAAIQAESATSSSSSSSAARGGDADLMDDEEAPSKAHAHDDGGAMRWPFWFLCVFPPCVVSRFN